MTTRHDVALLRLAAQRVVGPPWATPQEAVAWLTASQSQELPGALTSIALRTARRSAAEVVQAFDDGLIIRTWPMRGTLHTVAAADVRWMVHLMSARPMAAAGRRRSQLGLSDDDVDRARDLVTRALAGGTALTRAEVLDLWREAGVPVAAGQGYHLLVHLAHAAVLCLGPFRDGAARAKDQAFVLVEDWVPGARELDREEALAELALRYLRSHGPATVADLARWSGLGLTELRRGVAAVADRLETLQVDGVAYHLDPATPQLLADHRAAAQGVHLLPGFDEMVLGYADRSMTVRPEHAERIVPGGNGVFRPVVLAGGVAVGTWRARRAGVQTEPFDDWTPDVAAAVEEASAALP